MKITVEIPDEELKEMVMQNIADRIATNMYHGWHEGYVYKKEIKEVIREYIKDDIDNLSERAITAAAKSIENRSLKKIADSLVKVNE